MIVKETTVLKPGHPFLPDEFKETGAVMHKVQENEESEVVTTWTSRQK